MRRGSFDYEKINVHAAQTIVSWQLARERSLMFEATKKLIEHCKHLPQMSRIFSDPLVELAEKEIAQIESQLTKRSVDFASRCPKCNAIAGWHHEACEDYSPEPQSR